MSGMTTAPLRTRSVNTGPTASRRIALAALAGTTIEFYDFLVYGTAAALVFGTVFFPTLGAAAGTAAALATVGVAPLVRPVGAIIFGHLGDRLGRKRTLIYTLLLMGLASIAVGLLPATAAIGGAAPVVLVALRVLQGLAVGGEWGGAALLAVENARPGRRGSFGMYPQLGHGIAFTLTSATFLATGLTMSREAFLAWGWRIPFLLSVVLVGIGLYVRLRIEETPVFRTALARHGRSRVPLGEAFRRHAGQILLAGGALSPAFALGYLGTVYLTSYSTAVLGNALTAVLLLGVLGGVVLAAFTALSARMSDRFGRRRVILVGNVATIAVGLIVFPIIDTRSIAMFGLGLCLVLAVGGIGLGPAAAFLPELFATRYRYTGAGVAFNLAAILGGVVPAVLAATLQARFGSPAVGLLLAGLGLFGTCCVLVLPETRDRSWDATAPAARFKG
jgi:MFS family permease